MTSKDINISCSSSVPVLSPFFITGFSDAESSFNIRISPNKNHSTGWLVELSYQVGLHKKDLALLELINSALGAVGRIRKRSKGADIIEFRVSSLKGLTAIIAHFDKYPLISQKLADYILFKQAFEIVKQKEHLTKAGLQKIVNIRASINKGLPLKLKDSFPCTIAVARPLIIDQEIKNPD